MDKPTARTAPPRRYSRYAHGEHGGWAGPLRLACTGLLLLLTCPAGVHSANIFKYQKDGVWHFTDVPPADPPANIQQIKTGGPPTQVSEHQQGPLLVIDFPVRNAIEQAAAVTVAVQSSLGHGSGFFISAVGHILTNRHVIRSSAAHTAQAEAQFKEAEARIMEMQQRFYHERQQLQDAHTRLTHAQQSSVGGVGGSAQTHDNHRQSYLAWKNDFEMRFNRFDAQKRSFYEEHRKYRYNKSVADLAQRFTITLADGMETHARLVAISSDHDLALLKIDGYRTPCLQPVQNNQLTRGMPVYAIGSPAKLQNSVTSGILSGFQQGFVQTNAQIYPGNSGGPLVTPQGHVLGINTFKTLTRKFEGLGFAIPIQTALTAFRSYLPQP